MKLALLTGLAASLFITNATAQTDSSSRNTRSQQTDTTRQRSRTTPSSSSQAGSQQNSSGSQSGSRQKASTATKAGKSGMKKGSTSTGAVDSSRNYNSSGRTRQAGQRQTSDSSSRTSTMTDSVKLNGSTDTSSTTGTMGTTGMSSTTATTGSNRNNDSTNGTPSSVASSSATTNSATAGNMNSNYQQGNKIGKMTITEFNNLNAKGSQMVRAIKAGRGTLSQADQQLMLQVAAGGQRQLSLSQAVLEKVTNPQVKMLAASEVEEQTTIAAKLKEIAGAMGVTLPATTDSTGQTMKSQIQNLSGAQLDSFYLAEGGIRGHELLEQTMTQVSNTAKDATLKQLATATLPVIRTHLTVSRDVQSSMGSGAATSGSTGNQK